MEHTGRLARSVSPSARRILFGEAALGGWPRLREAFRLSARVDLAHVVMLAEQAIVPREKARRLLAEIRCLEREAFEPLRGRLMPRGSYLLYEDWLIERLGAPVAGTLQTARSRNDLGATVLRLQIREPYARLTRELLRLGAVLLRKAGRHARVVMPLYTHGQPALPSTYGHYLAGVAHALYRDLLGLAAAGEELDTSPLGAGAGAGTSWPIDVERTACLLGFRRAALHSIDAVASRDAVLRLLAAAAVCAVTLSRCATDLWQWSTLEFGFLDLPDSVVGSSSAMPQKRNPFLLEHVLGKTALVVGAFQGAAAAMHGAPFTNSISVGTEGIKPLWPAFAELTDAITLLRLVLAGARPRPERMWRSGVAGRVTAMLVADQLVREQGLDFRTAHAEVGRAVGAAEGGGAPPGGATEDSAARTDHQLAELVDPDLARAVLALRHGQGPAGVESGLVELRRRWRSCAGGRRARLEAWRRADARLDEAVAAI